MTARASLWLGSGNPFAGLVPSHIARRALLLCSYGALACLLGVLALVATATVPVLFGYNSYTVDGASMEPALKRGSVALAAPTSPRALRVGDIIAYRQSSQNPPTLHRIVQITNENGQLGFITQGDQNPTPDTRPVALQGPGDKVQYTVPYAGYILDFARSTLGKVLLIGVPLPVLLAMFLVAGKRPATLATASSPSTETRVARGEGAQNSPTRSAEKPSPEAQAFQRGPLPPRTQSAAGGPEPRPSLEAQALQRGPFSPTIRPVGRAPRPSLQAQALQRGLLLFRPRIAVDRRAARPRWRRRPSTRLLRAIPPASARAGPARQRRAA